MTEARGTSASARGQILITINKKKNRKNNRRFVIGQVEGETNRQVRKSAFFSHDQGVHAGLNVIIISPVTSSPFSRFVPYPTRTDRTGLPIDS